MASESGRSIPLWLTTAPILGLPRLERDARAEVCIVGAGIAGLSTAYELARQGRSVIVIDQARVGDGMTGRTTAHFTNAFDDRYCRMEERHGAERTRLLAESHTAAITRTAEIAAHERIDCELERLDGWLFSAPGEDPGLLEREFAAVQRAGLSGVELRPRAPLAHDTGPALRFPDQLQLHPVKYLHGLVRAIQKLGGRVLVHTHADIIEGGAHAHVQTEHGPRIAADAIVVATNSPVNDLAVVTAKQAAYQSYVVTARVPYGSVERALYWDTLDPYHYVRTRERGSGAGAEQLLIVGGEDHRTGQDARPEERWARLEEWMRAFFPDAGEVVDRWSGEVMEPVDGVAYIGKNPLDDDNVFVITGDSGNGLTHGVLGGILIADLVCGRPNPWRELYCPSRRSLGALGQVIKEGFVSAREYKTWFAPGDVEHISQIPRGEGALVRRGLKLYAVYVDERGGVHESLATCPHMWGVVRWNRAERTWDCPCHGSRFDATGRVIHGPAIVDLPRGPAASESA